MAVQYDEVEHKLQSLPHPSATADMLWQEQQEDINLVAHSFRYRNRRYSVVHSFRIFLGTQKLPCFLTFPYPVLVPKNCVIFIGCNFESRASQVGLHKQKKVCCVNKRGSTWCKTAAVRPFSSLRSKRFQSCYCAKVRAGAKKERCMEGRGRGGKRRRGNSVSIFPLPLPRQSFFSALVPIFSTNSRGNAYYAG